MTWNLRSSCLQLPSPVLTSMQHSSRFYTELRMEHKAWRRLGKSSTRQATSPASIVLELGKMYHSILELKKKKVFKFVWLLTFPQMPKIWEFKALLMFEERRKASFKVSMNLSVKKKTKQKTSTRRKYGINRPSSHLLLQAFITALKSVQEDRVPRISHQWSFQGPFLNPAHSFYSSRCGWRFPFPQSTQFIFQHWHVIQK